MLERINHIDYHKRDLLVTPDQLSNKMLSYAAVRMNDPIYSALAKKKSMNLKFINIVDPTFSNNNLGKSISRLNSSRIKMGMKLHMKRLNKLYDEAQKSEI